MLVYHHRLKSALIILSFSPQLCPCETPPGPTLHSCLGFVGQRCGPFGAGSGERAITMIWNVSSVKTVKEELFSLEKRRCQGDFTACFQYLKWAYKKRDGVLFTKACRDGTKGSLLLKEERFILDFRKKFFTQRIVRHWHSLTREAVGISAFSVLRPGWMQP